MPYRLRSIGDGMWALDGATSDQTLKQVHIYFDSRHRDTPQGRVYQCVAGSARADVVLADASGKESTLKDIRVEFAPN